MKTYVEWIAAYVAANTYLRGRCSSATKEMAVAFPELRRVAGFANGVEHFWCVDPNGGIVDPTVAQFGLGPIEYVPFRSGDEVRVGKCMECGSPIHAPVDSLDNPRFHKTFCDNDCRTRFLAETGA